MFQPQKKVKYFFKQWISPLSISLLIFIPHIKHIKNYSTESYNVAEVFVVHKEPAYW